jgi:hypothetical protein
MSLWSDACRLLVVVAPLFENIAVGIITHLAIEVFDNYKKKRKDKVYAGGKTQPMDGSISFNFSNKQVELIIRNNNVTQDQLEKAIQAISELKANSKYILILESDGKLKISTELEYIEKTINKNNDKGI